jgi:hypothetical protein
VQHEIIERAERALLERQALPEEFGPGTVRPSYDGLGLVNVPARALAWLAPAAPRLSDLEPAPPLAPNLLGDKAVTAAWQEWQARGPINHVIVLLLDALGYDQLCTMMSDGTTPNLAAAAGAPDGFFIPLTTVFPSTTTAALTSAATAYPPADHGITATVVYMREIGSAVNLIGYRPYIAPTPTSYLDPQLDPDALLPIPNVYRRLEEAGVAAEIVNAAALKGTSISRFTTAGSRAGQERYYGYVTPADGLARVRTRVTVQSAGRGFTYMYVSTVDSTAHRYGPLADSNRAEMAALDFAIRRELFEPLAGRTDTVLLLVADHGQRRSHNAHVAWLNRHPDLTRMVQAPLMGEGRAGYLYVKHGREGDVRAYLARYLAEEIQVVKKARAVELGLFGPPGRPLGPECDDRTGDLLLLPRGDWLVRQHVTTDEPLPPYTGVHGGLTRAEMLIPFLAYRF